MSYYFTNLVMPDSEWSNRLPAWVMHGTMQGRFVAITIRVRGSRWVCHPHPEGDEWHVRMPDGRIRKANPSVVSQRTTLDAPGLVRWQMVGVRETCERRMGANSTPLRVERNPLSDPVPLWFHSQVKLRLQDDTV